LVFRFLFPYLFLLVIILCYLFYRRMKLGLVLLKVDRALFTRYNNDSLLLIVIITVASYFLMRYELQSGLNSPETLILGPYTYAFFYIALIAAVIAREVEQPALREKGIASSRGFWLWREVESVRWTKNVVTLSINRGGKKRAEIWEISPAKKKELDLILKKMVTRPSGNRKKKV
jgi:hypothetical protein